MDLLNFTFNKKIVSEVVTLAHNQICGQTLSIKKKKNLHYMEPYILE